jgi:stage III sporulation protein AF
MMDTLTDIIRNVVALVLIFSCLELFLPAGELARFVRLACGLILLALIIIPAGEALKDISWDWTFSQENRSVFANYEDTANQITMILEEAAMDEYETDAAREIAAVALLAEGIETIDAVVEADPESGAIERVELIVTKDANTEEATAETQIKDLLARYFGIDEETIYLKIKEAG